MAAGAASEPEEEGEEEESGMPLPPLPPLPDALCERFEGYLTKVNLLCVIYLVLGFK
jgi:hypothetical protein